jgi:hypothetical protein
MRSRPGVTTPRRQLVQHFCHILLDVFRGNRDDAIVTRGEPLMPRRPLLFRRFGLGRRDQFDHTAQRDRDEIGHMRPERHLPLEA